MSEIGVSIICNAYNHELYIREALESFIMQKTTFPFEVLVHDDASTDNTAAIIREYEEKYPDIIKPIYQNENQHSQGIKIILTYQLIRAKGKYIAFCEGDDYWTDPYKLQKQFDIMEKNSQYSICLHKVKKVKGATKKIVGNFPDFDLPNVMTSEDIVKLYVEKGHSFQLTSYFVLKNNLVEYYEKDLKFKAVAKIGDAPMLLYFSTLGDAYIINDVLTCYRTQSGGNWTQKIDNNPKKGLEHRCNMYWMFFEFNKYTNYKYDDLLQMRLTSDRKLAYIIQILDNLQDFDLSEIGELTVEEKKEVEIVVKKLKRKRFIRQHFPHLVSAARWIKSKILVKRKK